jgi:uncharacterized protein (DUF1778 family)
MPATKDERLQIRLNPAEKHLLERAAEAAHQNVSAFVLQAAASRAEEILAERSVIGLTPQGAAALDVALARPAAVNERLATALQRPPGFGWVD